MHPSGSLIETLIDEKLTPSHRAIGVQAFLTNDMHLSSKKERGVRVDKQHGITRFRFMGIKCDSI